MAYRTIFLPVESISPRHSLKGLKRLFSVATASENSIYARESGKSDT
jgi:hypothetical protein